MVLLNRDYRQTGKWIDLLLTIGADRSIRRQIFVRRKSAKNFGAPEIVSRSEIYSAGVLGSKF